MVEEILILGVSNISVLRLSFIAQILQQSVLNTQRGACGTLGNKESREV